MTIPLNDRAKAILDRYCDCQPNRRQRTLGILHPALPTPDRKTQNKALHDIMKENTTFKITRQEEGLDEFLYCKKFEGTDVRVKPSLLFTTKQWINYITNKLVSGSVECNFIEQNLKNLHLERYLRA